MRLKEIELRNFKRFADFKPQFNPGINVVKGPLNEMGKSTLLEGIIAALFHNPKSTSKELKGYVSWGSPKRFRISLKFEDRGNEYSLEKDFDEGTASLTCDDTREEFNTFKKISEKMAELLGTSSDMLFLCTSCIRQSQVSEISSGKKEINESLEEIISGGKEGILASQVIQKLDSKITEAEKGLDRPAKNPGILASLKNKLQDTLRRYGEVRDEVSKAEAEEIKLMEMDKQLAQVKEQYENAKALRDKNEKRKKIEESVEELRKKHGEAKKRLDGINELVTKLKEANEALNSIEGFENEQQVSEFRRGLDAIQNGRRGIEEDLAQRETELAEAKEKLNRRKSVSFFGSGKGIATAIILFTGGIIGTLVGPLYLLSLIILGAVLLVISRWAGTTLAHENTSISYIKGRIQDMGEALGKLGGEEKELLAKAKCSTVGEFDRKEMDFKTSLKNKGDLEAQLKGMLGGKTVEDFQNQEQEIATDLAAGKAGLTDDLKATELKPEKYVELERKVQSLDGEKARLEDRKRDSEAVIRLAKEKEIDAEKQIKLEEERDRLQEELEREEKKVEAYKLAKEFVSKARTEVLSSTGEDLEKEIQRYLAVFTKDKYKQVRVDKEELEFWVYSDEKGDWAKPEDLSGGVIDEWR